MKQKIIGTGLSGLVGSRIVELLKKYEFEDISRKTGTDILDKNAVLERIKNSESEIVIHMAAFTNVDKAQVQKDLEEKSESWQLNVVGTQNVIDACEATGKRLIYISTDFVFSGNNTPQGGYRENDQRSPINWYGVTKYEGEKRIENSSIPWVIARIGFPYRADFFKKDFVKTFRSLLGQGKEINVVSDQTFTPTFIDDIAPALETLFNKEGIYHVVGSESLTVLNAALKIADIFKLDKNLIHPTTREEFFAGKALRPFNLTINNGKIKSVGVEMRTLEQGLEEIKRQCQ